MTKLKMLDNKENGKVFDGSVANIRFDSRLSIILVYFMIYAFNEFCNELGKIDSMKCIFPEPTFVKDDNESTHSNRVDINTCMYGREQPEVILRIVDQVWEDFSLIKEVKAEVLELTGANKPSGGIIEQSIFQC